MNTYKPDLNFVSNERSLKVNQHYPKECIYLYNAISSINIVWYCYVGFVQIL